MNALVRQAVKDNLLIIINTSEILEIFKNSERTAVADERADGGGGGGQNVGDVLGSLGKS